MNLASAHLSTAMATTENSKYVLFPKDPEHKRKLVTVRRVSEMRPCDDTSDMVVARFMGWECVVRAGLFGVGDLFLYAEVDSFLPASNPVFAKLGSITRYEGELGHHVRTKMYGRQISQGAMFKIEDFPVVAKKIDFLKKVSGDAAIVDKSIAGTDFAPALGVKKWEMPETMADRKLGKFPTFVRKTGMERVQNCPNLFTKSKYKFNLYQETAKLDGTSMTVYFIRKTSKYWRALNPLPADHGPNMEFENGRFGICSRSAEIDNIPQSRYWEMALKKDLPRKLSERNLDTVIQGELVGSAIAGNHHNVPRGFVNFYVFDTWDVNRQKYAHPKTTVMLADRLGLDHVPIGGYVKIRSIAKSHEDLLERARKLDVEGLVFKCLADGRRFKVLSNTWLLEKPEKEEETSHSEDGQEVDSGGSEGMTEKGNDDVTVSG